ncbi:MAG: FliM/FliN family flagellar motor switch protein [Planctomycetota bacterium]|jgi:flagellar motor switch protein FliN/FliY
MADENGNTEAQEATDGGPAVDVQEAVLTQAMEGNAQGGSAAQMDILMDTAMPVSVNLGQVELEVREVLGLGPGSVLKLDKQAGEPVDIFLRGVRFATGDLVVVGDQLGVRIREVLSEPQH